MRAEYLADECRGDESLRSEVESLLGQPDQTWVPASTRQDESQFMMEGRRIGVYQLQGLLGAGGMGEVYRARDTELGRDVAIKILPRLFTSDPDRLARFEREARVLASLNHPHIGAIYGLEDADGIRALVLELVEGETLADRITRGPIPVQDTLGIARQMADALDAAHERGIVHRDLKPANIKITPDGVVKVLDFGLAKATAGDRPGPDLTQSPKMTVGGTREGVILGTAAYMSPEQARGQTVDKRTDIWAFGCVLYQMLAGRPAFARETITDTLAAVVGGDTDWKRLPVDTPAGVRKVLRRCLDRDPRRRMRDIGEARFELDEAVAPGPDADALPPSDPRSRRHSWHSIALIALGAVAGGGALAAIALGVRGRADVPTPIDSMARTIATRLTSYGGNETYPALSPDGRTFVFVSDHGGSPDIWLRQVSGGEPVRLTNDPLEEAGFGLRARRRIDLFHQDRPEWFVYLADRALGGQSRKILADASMAVPAPDGRSLASLYLDPDNTGQWHWA